MADAAAAEGQSPVGCSSDRKWQAGDGLGDLAKHVMRESPWAWGGVGDVEEGHVAELPLATLNLYTRVTLAFGSIEDRLVQ